MGWIGYDRAVGHKGTNSPRLYLVDWRRWIGLATIERAGHDGIERHGHDQVCWSRWGGLATIGWGGLATTGRFGYDVAGWPRLGRLVAIGLRGFAMTGWVGHVGVGWHMMELFHLMEFHLESLLYWTKLVVPCWCAFLVQHRRWSIRLMEFLLESP